MGGRKIGFQYVANRSVATEGLVRKEKMEKHDSNSSGTPGAIPRRSVLKSMAGIAAAATMPLALSKLAAAETAKNINPKWYGFNLLEYFSTDPDWMNHFPYKNDGMFPEDDFKWIKDWGFNWVRLPMDYRFWTDPKDLLKINEKGVEPIDRAIKLGEKYGVHVNISLHRAPGECCLDTMDYAATQIHVTPEKTSVYTDQATQDAFVYQWVYFAERYKGISNEKLSFNLVNEPNESVGGKDVADGKEHYLRVARASIAGIRGKDAERLIVSDGYPWAVAPNPELSGTGIMQSRHEYSPAELTHYHCEWARPKSMTFPTPSWPMKDAQGKLIADKAKLAEDIKPWGELAKQGIPMHIGEMGCNRYTPPKLVHAWFNDALDVIGKLNSGWALWNFRGPYGVLDTNREGTAYTDFHGHKLDQTLLKILQSRVKA